MDCPKHILIVEDEQEVRSLLRDGFIEEGFRVSEADSLANLKASLETGAFDLITLDLGLPNGDGLALAHQIRSERNIPIIIISGHGTPEDRVAGLENGADDYIMKPFLMKEAIMRVRSVLKRYDHEIAPPLSLPPNGVTRYQFANGSIDINRRVAQDAMGSELPLTSVEFDLLAILVQYKGRILTRDQLSQILFRRPWSPSDRTIDGHIARLRRKIEPDAEHPQLIKTVRNVGYVFAGDARPART